MLAGSVSAYVAACIRGDQPPMLDSTVEEDNNYGDEDLVPLHGPKAMAVVELAATPHKLLSSFILQCLQVFRTSESISTTS